MTLPASGPISFSDVNVELGQSSTAQISMNDAAVRALFGVASGAISMADGLGKSNTFRYTITASADGLNINSTYLTARGWNGSAKVEITVAAGVYLYSTAAQVGLRITGPFPSGFTLINNGYIMGKGGNAADSVYNNSTGQWVYTAPVNATAGILLISTGLVTIDNWNGYIAGGGGYGSGNYSPTAGYINGGGGGGAGGGRGTNNTTPVPGPGGSSQSGASPYTATHGGMIIPGVGGSGAFTGYNYTTVFASGAGSGGGGAAAYTGKTPGTWAQGGHGGNGSANGGNGSISNQYGYGGGGGGGWGASGGASVEADAAVVPTGAGLGGKSVTLNGNTVAWVSGFPSTRVYGAVG